MELGTIYLIALDLAAVIAVALLLAEYQQPCGPPQSPRRVRLR